MQQALVVSYTHHGVVKYVTSTKKNTAASSVNAGLPLLVAQHYGACSSREYGLLEIYVVWLIQSLLAPLYTIVIGACPVTTDCIVAMS